ncbi:hypothetical protein N5D61_18715 [Pseudomonas sp. GD03842]|uniref:hypothetical protein n=1 Tax=Pseudomonas sp. GD03842 TaxID=2975385 RepID=UPI002447A055|nr:hypothetical protein [Pseudomonas sp. GD03842]MDH0748358.1 hypothetical protein [Pseudomonas sp. GD03842]
MGKLLTKLLIGIVQTIVTLTLTLSLAYCLMRGGPVDWVLATKTGADAHDWLLDSISWYGCESSEDALITLAIFSMLPPSIWICLSLSRYLKRVIVRGK